MARLLSTFAVAAAACIGMCAATTDSTDNTYDLGLRTLLVYRHPDDMQVARLVLDGYGTPFDATSSMPDLSAPHYHAIVLTSDTVLGGNLQPIRAYAQRYGVRIAVLHSTAQGSGPWTGVVPASWNGPKRVVFDTQHAAAYGDIMNVRGSWDVAHPAQFAAPVAVAGGAPVHVFMRYSDNGQAADSGPVAAYVANTTAGTQEMHFAFNAAANELCDGCAHPLADSPNYVQDGTHTLLSLALANTWLQWVTRGLYLGQRRLLLGLHVDDWFAANRLIDERTTVRMKGADVEQAVQWMQAAPARLGLAPGSSVVLEAAFNGAWHTAFRSQVSGIVDEGLNAASDQHVGSFYWVSHTWTHQQLDWLFPTECAGREGTCRTPAARIDFEIRANLLLATGHPVDPSPLIPAMQQQSPPGVLFGAHPNLLATHYSPGSLVTPEISGLRPASYDMTLWVKTMGGRPVPRNTAATTTMHALGIRAVVGDNSRAELVSKVSAHHGIMMTVAEYGVDEILIVPRHAANMAFGTHTPGLYTQWYNANGVCTFSPGPACGNRTDYTFEEAMHRQSQNAVVMWLQYRADPYMFHQSNLIFSPHAATNVSLLTAWADHGLSLLTSFVSGLPVRSLPMDRLAEAYRQRMQRDACGLQATVHVVGRTWQHVTLRSNASCTALLSSRVGSALYPSGSTAPETNGPDLTLQVNVTPTAPTTIPLQATPSYPLPSASPDPLGSSSTAHARGPVPLGWLLLGAILIGW